MVICESILIRSKIPASPGDMAGKCPYGPYSTLPNIKAQILSLTHKSQNARIPLSLLLLTPKYLSLFAPRPPSPYNSFAASTQPDSAIPALTPFTRFAHKIW